MNLIKQQVRLETLTIKIKDIKALKLIHDLEDLNLIQVINPIEKKSKTKLSEILSGSISPEQPIICKLS